MKEKVGSIEAIALVLIIVINHCIISFPKNIIASTYSASIINVIFITILALIFIHFVSKFLNKFNDKNILGISEFLGGKTLKYIVGVLFLIYFLFVVSITLRSFCESLKIIYFQNYAITFIIGLFILAIVTCNFLGLKSIVRSNLIISPLLIISIVFVFVGNIKNFNYDHIYPILGNGTFTTFISGMSNIYAFSSIAIIYFLPSYLKNNKEIKVISYTSTILSGVLLLISIASVLLIFDNLESIEQILPLYLVARVIEFGRFFQRIDAVFLLIWIISIISYLSFIVALCNNIFKELFNIENSNMLNGIWGLIVLGISLFPKNLAFIRFLENYVYKYSVIGIVFVFSFVILLLAYIKKKREFIHEKEQKKIL